MRAYFIFVKTRYCNRTQLSPAVNVEQAHERHSSQADRVWQGGGVENSYRDKRPTLHTQKNPRARPKQAAIQLAYSMWELAVTSKAPLSLLRTCFCASFCLNNTHDWTEGYKVVIFIIFIPRASYFLPKCPVPPSDWILTGIRSVAPTTTSIDARTRGQYFHTQSMLVCSAGETASKYEAPGDYVTFT